MGKISGATGAPSPKVQLNYQLLRNTTSPDELSTGVKSYVVNLPALQVLKLGTRANLRSYIPEYNRKKRNRVHDAIRNTIDTEPQRFITRNSGFAITASDITVDDHAKSIVLQDASVFNGAQSQGEIRRWADDFYGDELDEAMLDVDDALFYVRAEIIVDADAGEVVETAIARNTATAVKSVSQLGARGHLNDLANSIESAFPGRHIQKSETDMGAEDSRKILQYARLLMPPELSGSDSASEKVIAYRQAERCLMDFSRWAEGRNSDPTDALRYDFTVQIAPIAISEYEYWERHEAWNGQRVWEETKKGRACRRDESGKIAWVSPGLVFPIVGAMSVFVVQRDGRWQLVKPRFFKPEEMIARAVAQFRTVGSDPMQMGRSASVYDALRTYPATIIEVMKEVETG